MSDVETLMDRDPLELSTQDIDAIIAHCRAARNNFDLGQKIEKAKAPKAAAKPKAMPASGPISLADLFKK